MAKKKRIRKPKGKSSKAIVVADPAVVDPRQVAFLAAYTDPKHELFGNALQSALRAGYSQEYAESITSQMPAWLSENLGKDKRVKMAEKHLDEVLALPIKVQAMGAFGPIFQKERIKGRIVKKPVMVDSMSIVKQKTEVMKFALESLDKANYGKDRGPKIGFTFNFAAAKAKYKPDEL